MDSPDPIIKCVLMCNYIFTVLFENVMEMQIEHLAFCEHCNSVAG